MYPEDVCREALINAIAHRDYGIEGRSIEIFIFDDRMEVHSPGGLLSTVRVEELRKLNGLHQSRNALIARALREIGYMREMGEGLRRIFKLTSDADLVAPELRSDASKFAIVLSHKSVFSDADQRWLDGFKPLQLTREEMLVALLGRTSELLSAQKIYDTLGLVDWDVYRVVVDQMQAKGVLFNTSPRKTIRQARSSQKRRDVPRFAIRQPHEVDKGLAELFAACGRIPPVRQLTSDSFKRIAGHLLPESIYRSSVPQMEKVMRVLDLIDDHRHPTEILLGIWRAQAATDASTGQAKAERQPGILLSAVQPIASRPVVTRSRDDVTAEARTLFVGNVDFDTTATDLHDLFSQVGTVASVKLPVDYVTQRGRGFAFVCMSTELEAAMAIQKLSGKLLAGRSIRVASANAKKPRAR